MKQHDGPSLRARAALAGIAPLHLDDFSQEKAVTGAIWSALRERGAACDIVSHSMLQTADRTGGTLGEEQLRPAWTNRTPAPDLLLLSGRNVRLVLEVKIHAKLNGPELNTVLGMNRLRDPIAAAWDMSKYRKPYFNSKSGKAALFQTDLYRCFDWTGNFRDSSGQPVVLEPASACWLFLDADGRDGQDGRSHALAETQTGQEWTVLGFAPFANRILDRYEGSSYLRWV